MADTLEKRVTDLEQMLAHIPEDLDARFAGVDVKLAEIREVLALHTTRFTKLEARLNDLERKVETGLNELDRKVKEVDRKVGDVDRKVDGLDRKVGDLDRKVDDVDRKVDRVDGKLDEVLQRLPKALADLRSSRQPSCRRTAAGSCLTGRPENPAAPSLPSPAPAWHGMRRAPVPPRWRTHT
jgi:chromosome segregation ATPase